MRQICPSCQKSIEVPDSAVGGEYACTACGKSFPVPKAYTPTVVPPAGELSASSEPTRTPAVDRPAPPPGYIPAPPPPVPSADSGELRSCGITLSPAVVGWVPVVCLTLCLLLSFFPWVGAYPGGYRVFSQHAWEAGFGWLGIQVTAVPQILDDAERDLKALLPMNLFMVLYGILLILTVILAWIERVLTSELDVLNLPGPLAWLPTVWPYRFTLLIGLATLLLFFVIFQMGRGFGLETAVAEYAATRHAEALAAPDLTEAKRQVAYIQIGMDTARFALRRTTVLSVVLAAHILALLGLLTRIWLTRRGNKQPPRLVIQY